jgi:predicted nucleic acid-binding protein
VIVVADASPLRYLILIEHVHVLPALFGEVIVPPVVVAELTNEQTPQEVRRWLADKPEWLRVQTPRETLPQLSGEIDEGEREAIALAVELRADALLIDDRHARRHAEALTCPAVGTLGVLAELPRGQSIDRGDPQQGQRDVAGQSLVRLAVAPAWDNLRCDPRYDRCLRRVRRQPVSRTRRVVKCQPGP